jgi:hypothetical protein
MHCVNSGSVQRAPAKPPQICRAWGAQRPTMHSKPEGHGASSQNAPRPSGHVSLHASSAAGASLTEPESLAAGASRPIGASAARSAHRRLRRTHPRRSTCRAPPRRARPDRTRSRRRRPRGRSIERRTGVERSRRMVKSSRHSSRTEPTRNGARTTVTGSTTILHTNATARARAQAAVLRMSS